MYEGPPIEDKDILSVYVILNGSLNMSPGKMASQAFHCGWLAHTASQFVIGIEWDENSIWDEWGDQQGRRVNVRIAETEFLFQRVMDECEGKAQQDEGLTEVERGSITAFVTIPYRRDEVPKILTHKKVQLL